MSTGCSICDRPGLCMSIDGKLEQHINYTTIAEFATAEGYPLTPPTVSRHDKHRAPSVRPDVKVTKRDAAIIIKDRVLDALEAVEDREGEWIGEGEERHYIKGSSILSKDLQPALSTALKAQAIEDRREQRKPQQNFWIQLYTGQQVQTPLLADGIVDGEAIEVLYPECEDSPLSEDG